MSSNTFDGGVDLDPVTTANSGGASGDAFNTVTLAGAGSVVYSDDHSVTGLAAKITRTASSSDSATLAWTLSGGTRSGGWVTFYLTNYPAAVSNDYFLDLVTVVCQTKTIHFTVTNLGRLTYVSESPAPFNSTVVPLNQWCRLEWDLTSSGTRSIDLRCYFDASGFIPDIRLTDFNPFFSNVTHTEVRFGSGADQVYPSAATFYLDDLTVNNTGNVYTPPIQAPVAVVEMSAPAPVVPVDIIIAAPVAVVEMSAPVPVLTVSPVIVAPVVVVEVSAPAPALIDATATLISPTAAQPVPSLLPVFRVAVGTDDPAAVVEIQYDTAAGFTSPTTLTAPSTYGLTTTYVSAKATVALTNGGTYFWRARVVNDFDTTAWSASESFVVSDLDGEALIGGQWNVDPDQVPYPHLWWTVPDRGRPGDAATAVGTGFGPTAATITLSGVSAAGTLRTVAASADAYTANRVLDRDSDDVDPGHMRVDFIVPTVGAPGGPLYVDGS